MATHLDHNATSPMHPEVADATSFSAHKLRGSQGVGALAVNRKPRNVLISGGYQENRLRGGTDNVAGIVGLGKAAQAARLEMAYKKHHLEQLRDAFEARLETIPGNVFFGQRARGYRIRRISRRRTIMERPC